MADGIGYIADTCPRPAPFAFSRLSHLVAARIGGFHRDAIALCDVFSRLRVEVMLLHVRFDREAIAARASLPMLFR